ncbi:MAG: response regulator [Chitinivibrionales bacterium]|nr:response regulator [Chitinivibrionales bacterium]
MQRTALIVDDSRIARRMLRKSLPPEWAVSVLEATNGREGLELCEQHDIEVMFLDLTMPEVDGMAVLDKIKHLAGRPKVTLIVSADVQPESKALALFKGAFEFIAKPASTETLRAALSRAGVL